MKIEVRFRGIDPSDALRAQATRAIVQHLARFAPDLDTVIVRIDDVNGPRGGMDKHCRVVARGTSLSATTSERGADAYAVVATAVEGVSRALERRAARLRSYRRIVGAPPEPRPRS
jgi:hypothetical protein